MSKSIIDPEVKATEAKPKKAPAKKAAAKKPSTKAPKAAKEDTKADEVETDELLLDEPPEESNGLIPEDEMNIQDIAVMLQQMFARKQVQGMTYSEKKEVYGNGPKSADKLQRNVNARAKSQTDWTKEEYAELAQAASKRETHIKWVKLIGVEDDDKYGICMIARLCNKDPYTDQNRGQFKIKIPVSEFAVFDPSNPSYQGKDGYFHFTRELDNWVGNNIQVIIYNVVEKDRVAFASRLAASVRLSSYYFKGKKPRFKEGQILTGQVMSAKRDRVTVSVYGQDFNIKTEEATWTAALPLHEEFKVGQYVDVKILSVDNSFVWKTNQHEYQLTKLTGSIKQATENPNELYYDDFELEGKYIGQVKSSTADGMKVFVVVANKILVMCDAPQIGTLGDRVYLKITKKEDKTHQFWGKIVRASI